MKEALLVLLVTCCLLLVLEAAQGSYHQGQHHGPTPGHHAPPGHHGPKGGGGHQGHKHKGGHHKGHHGGPHHDLHNESHEPRADRIRRQKDLPPIVTDSDESSTVGPIFPCITNENCTSFLAHSTCENEECVCTKPYEVLDVIMKECLKPANLNSTCRSDLQCEKTEEKSFCNQVKKLCLCVEGFTMKTYPEVGYNCGQHKSSGFQTDPTMIIILGVMAAMFVIICVVLRLFSKARFRENRSIFNTPNPRLMNASLFKDSKLLSPAHDARRGSRASVRPPSRAPSVTSVNISGNRSRTGSRNGSIAAQGRRGSAISTASAAGSTIGGGGRDHPAKTPSPIKESKKETTVAIETVD